MLTKIGNFFGSLKVIGSVLAALVIFLSLAGNAYTDYKLKNYVTIASLDKYMIKRDVSELLRRIEYLKLDLRGVSAQERRTIMDKISLINTQIRQIRGK